VKAPYTGFVLDQDTGGAIRAPGRCDVYMGVGDQAGEMAGQVYEEGQLYYLFVKTGTPSLPVPIGIR
jgi:membrane-bound lytic murein transglycosylase A